MSAKYLITGATGNVGSAVVDEFVRRGVRARVASRSAGGVSVGADGMTQVPFDYTDNDKMKAAFTGVEVLFLMTPVTDRQVDWATRAIDLAVQAGVKRIVRLSVAAAAMVPGIQLGRWHRTVERYLQASGVEWTIVRPVPYMQNFLGLFPVQAGGEYVVPLSDGKMSLVDTQDVGRFVANAMLDESTSNQTFLVTSDQVLTAEEAVERINDMLVLQMKYAGLSPDQWQELMQQADTRPAWLLPILKELFTVLGSGMVTMTNGAFEQALGSRPGSFEAFVTRNSERFVALAGKA